MSVVGYPFDSISEKAGFPLKEMITRQYKTNNDLTTNIEMMREKGVIHYPELQTSTGQNGAPIMLWNGTGFGAIIGVHTAGDGDTNYGTVFFDDWGLVKIFGYEDFKAFLDKCKEYKPIQFSSEGTYKW